MKKEPFIQLHGRFDYFSWTYKIAKFWMVKTCVRYFLSIFYFSPNDSPSKTMKSVFYFVWKALPLFFSLSVHCFRGCSKINLKVYNVINCLNKNLITHFVLYSKKEKSYGIETLSIDRVLNKEHFYGKILQKMCTKS